MILSFLFAEIRGISHFSKHKGKTGWDSKFQTQGRERLAAVCLVFFTPLPWVPPMEHFMSSLSCEYVTPSVLCPLICYFGRKWEKWREFLNLLIFLFPLEEATEHTNFPQNYFFLRRNSVFHPVLAAVGFQVCFLNPISRKNHLCNILLQIFSDRGKKEIFLRNDFSSALVQLWREIPSVTSTSVATDLIR